MTEQRSPRQVTVQRVAAGRYRAVNARGGEISIGNGEDTDFSPVELLLAAIGGCTSVDVDAVTSRRSEPDQFDVDVTADKVKDADGNRLADIHVTFKLAFPEGAAGDEARSTVPRVVQLSHDKLCTVSRTVELGVPVTPRIA